MKTSRALIIVTILAGLLAVIQAGAGLFFQDGGAPFPFTTLRGESVQMNGQGLYRYDTAFRAPIFRGTDAVTLFGAVPLLAAALFVYRKGSLAGQVFLPGVLSYFLYNSASVALGVAYNNLFLVYIAYFSASLFAFALACIEIDYRALSERVSGGQNARGLPARGMAALMFLSGAALLYCWLPELVHWMRPGAIPGIASYTTEVTHVLDLGVIAPAAVLAGVLALRRSPAGYLMSAIILVLLAIIAVVLLGQTIFQISAGFILPPGVYIGKNGSFMLLSLFAVWLIARFYRGLSGAQAGTAAAPEPGRA